MTARLLIGPAGSGKTRRCLQALRDCERAGEAALLVVPDQFTYAADRLLLEQGSLAGTRHARVISFRRLARMIAAGAEPAPDLISDEGRRLILYPILQSLPATALGPFAPVRLMPGFVAALADAVAEVKGIGGDEAAERLALAAGAGAKAAAFARIVREYDAALAGAGLRDPGDWMRELAADLERRPARWSGLRLWMDGFMSFTPEERALLPPLAAAAREFTITLCADGIEARALLAQARDAADFGADPLSSLLGPRLRSRLRRPQFLPVLRTALWLQQRIAGLVVEALPEAPRRFGPASELALLEAGLFAGAPPDPRSAPAVRLRVCATPYHEVVAWARRIDARARLGGGWRYRDWAVLVRDLGVYRPLVREVFGRYGIPVYLDERRDATAHPLARLHLTLLRLAARGWARELVLELLRNPLLGVPAETADRIENLALEYGIDYERWWKTDWRILVLPPRESARGGRGDPEGEARGQDDEGEEDGADDDEDAADTQDRAAAAMRRRRLAAADARAVSRRVFPAALGFTSIWRGREWPFAEAVAHLGRAIGALLEQGAAGRAPEGGGEAAEPALDAFSAPTAPAAPLLAHWTAEETQRIAELLRETLALGGRLMGATPIDPGLFARLLREGLDGATIGLAPQGLDAVTVADPRRSRVNETRGAIVGGLTASAFPREAAEDPLFSDAERREIAAGGFPIGAHGALRIEEDPYLFYVACTRAREELLLTRPALDAEGGGQEPSPYLAEVERSLGRSLSPAEEGAPGPLDRCLHAGEVEPLLARALGGLDGQGARRLAEEALAQLTDLPPLEAACARSRRLVEHLRDPLPERLDRRLAARLFPERVLSTSASRLETFASCPFRHFARHILRLEPRPEAVLTPLSTGSAVHAALQRFFAGAPRRESADEAASRMGELFNELAREEEFRIFQEDPPSRYRWSVTRRETALFIRTEHRRLCASRFQPRAVELSFGLGARGGDPAEAERARRRLLEGPCLTSPDFPALELPLPADPVAGERAAGGRILLRGRIDRLDLRSGEGCGAATDGAVAADGAPAERGGAPAAVVFDYKRTGRGRAPGGELARGLDLQIATYLLAVRRVLGFVPLAGFYYSVGPRTRATLPEEGEGNPYGFRLQGFRVSDSEEAIDPQKILITPRMRGDYKQSLDGVLGLAGEKIAGHGERIVRGVIRPAPVERGGRLPCDACDFAGVCRFDPTSMRAPGAPPADEEGA